MNAIQIVLGLILAIALIFIAPLVGICVGAFAGWVAGLFFPHTLGVVATVLSNGLIVAPWQIGAALGCVGGFFKTRVSQSND